MRRLTAVALTLALLAAASACGRYGPPRRTPRPDLGPPADGAHQSGTATPREFVS